MIFILFHNKSMIIDWNKYCRCGQSWLKPICSLWMLSPAAFIHRIASITENHFTEA